MPRRTLDQKLQPLAQRFAQQVARLVEADTRKAIAAEVKRQLRGLRSSGGTSAPRTVRKVVVECPMPGCRSPGVRTLSNFCVEHNRAMSAAEKKRLREAQRQARAKST